MRVCICYLLQIYFRGYDILILMRIEHSGRVENTKNIYRLEELRELIEKHDAWGISLDEFQKKAGYHKKNNIEYITDFRWGSPSSSLQEKWDLVQYIHKYYGLK